MIRPMTKEDITYVQQIVDQTWEVMYDGILPREAQIHYLDRSYSDFMLMKRMEKTVAIVIEDAGVPVGFINYTRTDEDGDAELTALHISPSCQRSGYGEKLLRTALATLADTNQLFAYVDGNNEIGRAFYEKHGFQLLDVFNETFEGYPVETAQYVYIQAKVGIS